MGWVVRVVAERDDGVLAHVAAAYAVGDIDVELVAVDEQIPVVGEDLPVGDGHVLDGDQAQLGPDPVEDLVDEAALDAVGLEQHDAPPRPVQLRPRRAHAESSETSSGAMPATATPAGATPVGGASAQRPAVLTGGTR